MSESIFVFATNESGHHENEIAKLAMHAFGAQKSHGKGLVGQSYAIPVLDRNGERLPKSRILDEFAAFKHFAGEHPELQFQLSRIGCDSIGFREEGVVKYFIDCPDNVRLPGVWERHRNPDYAVFAVTGTLNFSEVDIVHFCLDTILDYHGVENNFVEYLTGDEKGVDFICGAYFASKGLPSRIMHTNWERYGPRAGAVRNRLTGLTATHILLIDDGACGKTAHMRRTAKSEGLTVFESSVAYTDQSEQYRVLQGHEVAERVRALSAEISA